MLPLSVAREPCYSGHQSHASNDDSSADAKFFPVWSSGLYMVLHETVGLQLSVVSYNINYIANALLTDGTRQNVCICNEVLHAVELIHYLYTGPII